LSPSSRRATREYVIRDVVDLAPQRIGRCLRHLSDEALEEIVDALHKDIEADQKAAVVPMRRMAS